MSKGNSLYYAEKASPVIPNKDGTPSEYKFGDDIEIWIPAKSKIAGYTYDINGDITLIAMYQDSAYTFQPPMKGKP